MEHQIFVEPVLDGQGATVRISSPAGKELVLPTASMAAASDLAKEIEGSIKRHSTATASLRLLI